MSFISHFYKQIRKSLKLMELI